MSLDDLQQIVPTNTEGVDQVAAAGFFSMLSFVYC